MSDGTRTARHVDPSRLSAYYDGDVRVAERQTIEQHLGGCAACRQRLAEYSMLGSALRSEPLAEATNALDIRVSAVLRGTRRATRGPAPQPGVLRPARAAALLVAMLAGVLMVALPLWKEVSTPRIAAAYLYDDRGEPAVAVRFTGPIDRGRVEQTVRFDPPVRVNVAWQGDTMLVKPAEPLQPEVTYTLNVNPEGPTADAKPVAIPFATSVPPSPTATEALPVVVPTATPTATATASPTGSPTATATGTPSPTPPPSPTATSTAAPAAFQPVRGFGALYRGQPAVAAGLGNALEAEHGMDAVVQPFERGLLLWRGDRREILVLLDNRQWRSYADTFTGEETTPPKPGEPVRGFGKLWREQSELRAALGSPTAPESPIGAVLQPFERGQMVWTADRTIFVLYVAGSWERYADTFVETAATPTATRMTTATAITTATATRTTTATATTTPAASATATTTASATAPTAASATATTTATASATVSSTSTATSTLATTGTPSPTATTPSPVSSPTPGETGATATTVATATGSPTPAIPGCPATPVRGLGLVYQENPTVASSLGCALIGEASVQLVRQSFERGVMLWRSDTREILVFLRDGSWASYQDAWQESEGLGDPGQPPEGLIGPIRGFGKIWRQHAEVRQAIGWATSQEQPVAGVVQQFARGRMIWTGDRFIYVLYNNGAFQGFVDTYVEPAPGPR